MMVLLWACTPSLEVHEAVEVRTWAADVNASGGRLTVQTSYEPGLTVDLPVPEVQGLTFSPDGEPRLEKSGGRVAVTQAWKFTGKKGSYEIPSLVVSAGEVEAKSLPIWVDLGVEAGDAAALQDISDPQPVRVIPWAWICAAGGVLAVMVGGVGMAFVGLARPRKKTVKLLPPDVRCLRAWEEVRAHPDLSNEDKAKELSRLFREYTEEVLQFPAASWTSTEILEKLAGMQHLPKGNTPRAKRLLRATDLVKYAEVSPDTDFFEELDADLRAFVGSTRPKDWRAEQEEES